MPALTLTQCFGANATLTNGTLTIQLSDFPALNSANPSASKIMAAIMLALKTTTATLREDSTVGIVSAIEYGNEKSFVQRGDPAVSQIQTALTFNLYTADSSTALDPDDVL
jgi:hypothetical protein